MRLAFSLAWRSLRFTRWRTGLLVLALGLTIALPLTVRWLIGSYTTGLTARAAATPLVFGAPGNRFDLVLSALWFRQAEIAPVPFRAIQAVNDTGTSVAIPLHVRFSARGAPVVGTTPEYYERRGLAPAAGSLPLRIGEVVLGATVAERLELGPGGALLTDQKDVYDLAAAYPLKLAVTGVLRPTGGPDDSAAFVDIKTAWIIQGIGHGHRPADGRVEAGEVQYQAITDANRAQFHAHGDPGGHPLTAALVFPRDHKALTLLKARTNVQGDAHMVAPEAVVTELLGVIVQIERFLTANFAVIGLSALIFIGLVFGLSLRMRAAELREFDRLGASRGFVVRLLLAEWALLALGALLVALIGLGLASLALPDLTSIAR